MSEADQTGGREEIWLEKYRPQRLEDVVGQDAIVERLQSYVDRDDLSHMLFAGPAGVGKCTTAETPVLTSDGLSPIEDIVGDVDGFESNESGTEILTYTSNGEFEYTEPSHAFAKKAEDLLEVRTRDGAKLTVTPEHKLLVVDSGGFEWRRADALNSSDRIVRPLDAPLPETDTELHWMQEMDDTRTFVHLSTAFSQRHEIPFEENLVGTKKKVAKRLREGQSVDEIDAATAIPRKTITAARREFSDEQLQQTSTICSLGYLREMDLETATLRNHVEAVQYVTTTNNRSTPIAPPWEVTPALATVLGLAISEARIENGRIKFYNTDETLLTEFEETIRDLFDVDPTTGVQQGVRYVRISNKTLTHFLRSCFDVFESTVGGDAIGSKILQADEQSRRAFLRSVFDAEGHVTKNGIIELTQKNGRIITLLSYLLAGLGVPSRRKTESKRATNGTETEREYHTIYISSTDHCSQFASVVGFSIPEKKRRLDSATDRSSNPNDDTIPTQEAVSVLCEQLNLTKGQYISDSLNPASPGRERYLSGVSALVDDATARLEAIQEARESLTTLSPTITEISHIPVQWTQHRDKLDDPEIRTAVAAETGIKTTRLQEYALGERTPYTGRVQELLAEVVGESREDPITVVQEKLQQIIDDLDISYNEIARETDIRGTDISNLLQNDDHEIGSLVRFTTVRDRLDTILAEMASMETLEKLRSLSLLVDSDIYLDKVHEVRSVDESKRVYDLTVPETRNYVAGDVPTVLHNTTSAIAIAKELYGENWEDNFLELNASDERGIDVVRDRVKSFARTSFGGHSYRIIFLDEADALTSDAQSALRRTMEQFSNNVRFILSCNYSSQIIDPIQSRCAVFRFSPLPDEAVEQQVRTIADAEGIEVTDDGVDALVYVAGGDMRAAINGLQAAAVTGAVVDEEAVFEITSTARPEDIEEMVTHALDGDFTAARSQLDRLLTEEGIAGGDVIDQLHRSVWEFDLGDEAAVRLLDRIGEADYRITAGANERIQLEALLASVALDE
jgi:DNA polymerase III delta prime subunit